MIKEFNFKYSNKNITFNIKNGILLIEKKEKFNLDLKLINNLNIINLTKIFLKGEEINFNFNTNDYPAYFTFSIGSEKYYFDLGEKKEFESFQEEIKTFLLNLSIDLKKIIYEENN